MSYIEDTEIWGTTVEDYLKLSPLVLITQAIYTLIVWLTIINDHVFHNLLTFFLFLSTLVGVVIIVFFLSNYDDYAGSQKRRVAIKIMPIGCMIVLIFTAATLMIVFITALDKMFVEAGWNITCIVFSTGYTLYWSVMYYSMN